MAAVPCVSTDHRVDTHCGHLEPLFVLAQLVHTSRTSRTSHTLRASHTLQVESIQREGERGFLIRWAGYSAEHDSWEPEANINAKLVADFRLQQEEAERYRGTDYLRGTERRLWCRACKQHAHPDNFSQQARPSQSAVQTPHDPA